MSIVSVNARARGVGEGEARSLLRAPHATCTVMCTSNAKLRVSCAKDGKVDISLNDGAPETWDARALEAALLARYAKELLRLVAPRPDAQAAESAFSALRRVAAVYGPQGRQQEYLRPTPARQQRWAAEIAQDQQQLGNIGTVIGGLSPYMTMGVIAALIAARAAILLPNFADRSAVRGSGALFAPFSAGAGGAAGPLGPARAFPEASTAERPIPHLFLPEGERNASLQALAPIVFAGSETTQARAFADVALRAARAHAVCYASQADIYWERGNAELVIAALPNPPGFYAKTSLALARLCCEERSAPETDALAGEIGQCFFGKPERLPAGQSGPYPYSQFSMTASGALLALTGSTTVIAIRKHREARFLASKIVENEEKIAQLRVELGRRRQLVTYLPPDTRDALKDVTKNIAEKISQLQQINDFARAQLETERAKSGAELATLREELAEARRVLEILPLDTKNEKALRSMYAQFQALKESERDRIKALENNAELMREMKTLKEQQKAELQELQAQVKDGKESQLKLLDLLDDHMDKNHQLSEQIADLTIQKFFEKAQFENKKQVTLALIHRAFGLDNDENDNNDVLRLEIAAEIINENRTAVEPPAALLANA
jgi:hypothetical protein